MEETGKLRVALPHEQEYWPTVKEVLEQEATNLAGLQQQMSSLLSAIGKKAGRGYSFSLFEQYEEEIVPFMKGLVLRLPELFPEPLYHLTNQNRGSVSLTREQTACLLACSSFCLFSQLVDRGLTDHRRHQWPFFSLTGIFSNAWGSMGHFGRCVVHYFSRISKQMPTGNVVFTRVAVDEFPEYSESTKKICRTQRTEVHIEKQRDVPFHADFANKFIGGGVLEGGCVQEEILFVLKPECLPSLLLCSMMDPNEAIIISGAEQFSNYKGYGHSFTWDSDFVDTETPRYEKFDCLDNHIIGVDAVMSPYGQFEPATMTRDINKLYSAFVGFPEHTKRVYATGHWGCGAFGGNKELKAIQQIISASEADVTLTYCCFGHVKFEDEFAEFLDFLESHPEITVADLYDALMSFPANSHPPLVFDHVRKTIEEKLNIGPAPPATEEAERAKEEGEKAKEEAQEEEGKVQEEREKAQEEEKGGEVKVEEGGEEAVDGKEEVKGEQVKEAEEEGTVGEGEVEGEKEAKGKQEEVKVDEVKEKEGGEVTVDEPEAEDEGESRSKY